MGGAWGQEERGVAGGDKWRTLRPPTVKGQSEGLAVWMHSSVPSWLRAWGTLSFTFLNLRVLLETDTAGLRAQSHLHAAAHLLLPC